MKLGQKIILLATLLGATSYGAEKEGPLISLGIVYPSMQLAAIYNPAYLSLTDGDRVELLVKAPITYNEETEAIEQIEEGREGQEASESDSEPVWLGYGGSPRPFGLGMAIRTVDDEPTVNFGWGFGTERFQVGYTFQSDPINEEKFHEYSLRVGDVKGPAAAIKWNDGTTMVAGIGFMGDVLVAEVDAVFDTEYEGDPLLTFSFGAIGPRGGIVIGYSPDTLRDEDTKDDISATLSGRFSKNFAMNLYYERYFGEFILGLCLIK